MAVGMGRLSMARVLPNHMAPVGSLKQWRKDTRPFWAEEGGLWASEIYTPEVWDFIDVSYMDYLIRTKNPYVVFVEADRSFEMMEAEIFCWILDNIIPVKRQKHVDRILDMSELPPRERFNELVKARKHYERYTVIA